MTHQSSWESLANEFEHFGQPLRADWFACEGREDYGIWLLLPDGPDSQKIRASFSLIAARAIEKSGISPKPLPQPQQHDPHWDLYCQLEEEAAQRAGKTIALSDAVPYGLGDVDRDAVEAQGKGDISILPARGHFYFALTPILRLLDYQLPPEYTLPK
jgi:hypothetical protein